jgi:hypothetical protein
VSNKTLLKERGKHREDKEEREKKKKIEKIQEAVTGGGGVIVADKDRKSEKWCLNLLL